MTYITKNPMVNIAAKIDPQTTRTRNVNLRPYTTTRKRTILHARPIAIPTANAKICPPTTGSRTGRYTRILVHGSWAANPKYHR
jgi:hypothetical protein